jgi:uncharacterized protein YhbP (UPF0306 family)
MTLDVEKTVRKYLKDAILLSLASCRGEKPWICELIFAYDKDLNLYFRSLPTRRHSGEIADNPNVAGSIVRPFRYGEFPHGVYFEGMAEVLPPGSEEQEKAFNTMQDRLHMEDDIFEEAQNPDGHQFYKITVTEWRVFVKSDRDRKSGETHKLPWGAGVAVSA